MTMRTSSAVKPRSANSSSRRRWPVSPNCSRRLAGSFAVARVDQNQPVVRLDQQRAQLHGDAVERIRPDDLLPEHARHDAERAPPSLQKTPSLNRCTRTAPTW